MVKDKTRGSALVVDNDPAFRETLARMLTDERWDVATAAGAAESLERFKVKRFGAAVIDVNLGLPPDGIALAQELLRREPGLLVLIMSGDAENEERRKRQAWSAF